MAHDAVKPMLDRHWGHHWEMHQGHFTSTDPSHATHPLRFL